MKTILASLLILSAPLNAFSQDIFSDAFSRSAALFPNSNESGLGVHEKWEVAGWTYRKGRINEAAKSLLFASEESSRNYVQATQTTKTESGALWTLGACIAVKDTLDATLDAGRWYLLGPEPLKPGTVVYAKLHVTGMKEPVSATLVAQKNGTLPIQNLKDHTGTLSVKIGESVIKFELTGGAGLRKLLSKYHFIDLESPAKKPNPELPR